MECKVFAANNVEIVTKTRTEHMTQEDKDRAKANKNPLLSFFGPQEVETEAPSQTSPETVSSPASFSEYLARGWVRPRQDGQKGQKFKAQLWLCEEYPLSLQEQVMPIVDLLAISNTHFKKLKDFIHMQLPSGFPVKIGNNHFANNLSHEQHFQYQKFLCSTSSTRGSPSPISRR